MKKLIEKFHAQKLSFKIIAVLFGMFGLLVLFGVLGEAFNGLFA